MDNFRNLTDAEIAALEAGGSSAENWSDILVADGFDPSRIRDSVFSGPCRIGSLSGYFSLPGGVTKPAGIYRATLHNVTVGDNVRISNVRSYIANYDIGDGAHIGNVDKIYVEGESSFGNGVEVSVLNEVGGREVTIHDRMTAHEAYIEAMYRHRPLLIERLKGFARKRAEECRSSRGMIGRSATVLDTGLIRNVRIGSRHYSPLEGL